MQTYLDQFREATANYITTSLLEPICQWIREHPGEEVTPEKLMQALELPAPKTRPAPSTPQSLAGNSLRNRRNATVKNDRPQCEWVFLTGKKAGTRCTGRAVEGLKFCSACKNKKRAGGSGRPSKNSETTAQPGLSSPEQPNPDEEEITVDPFGRTSEGYVLLIDAVSGYILKETSANEHVIVGICTNRETKEIRSLSEDEQKEAKNSLGLDYEEGAEIIPDN